MAKQNNSIANAILSGEQNHINPHGDIYCKQLLAYKQFLARIMKGCIPEYANCTEQEIMGYIEEAKVSCIPVDSDEMKIVGNNTEASSLDEGKILFDIVFDARFPTTSKNNILRINIEAQGAYNPGYALTARAIYYCARLISSQKQTVFEHSDYGDIHKVYSTWLCFDPGQNRQGAKTTYKLQEFSDEDNANAIRFKKEEYDKMGIIMIGIENDIVDPNDSTQKTLAVLFNISTEAKEKIRILEEKCHISMTKDMKGALEDMCNYGATMEKYGAEKGAEKERINNMLTLKKKMNWNNDTVVSMFGVPDEEKSKYIAYLEKATV